MTFDGSSSSVAGATPANKAAADPADDEQRSPSAQEGSASGPGQTPVNGNGDADGTFNGNGRYTLTEGLAKGIREANDAVTDVLDLVAKVRFEVREVGAAVLVQVVDRDSAEVVRQIPSAEFLALHQKLEEFRSLLLDDVA